MTSRERVKRCVTFTGTDRVPMTFPEPYPNDFVSRGVAPDPNWKPSRTWEMEDGAQWEDEWGNVWKRFSNTTRGEVIEGGLKDWDALSTYKMPSFDQKLRYQEAKDAFDAEPDKYHLGHLPGFPFAIMRYMRLMEEFLADVLLYPKKVMELQGIIVRMLKGCMDQFAWAGADGVMWAEDWGTQERLLVSPKCWHEIFEPGYRELVEHAKKLGLHTWMHSCGYIKDIIPTLANVGVTVLQLDQPELSGIDWLRETIGGRVSIWSPIDTQWKLPKADKEQIQATAREYIDKLGSFNGGFIAGYYWSPESLGIDPQWQIWGVEEFIRHAKAK